MNYSCHSDLEMKESRKGSEKRTSGRERRKLGSIHEHLLQKGTQKTKAETVCKTWWKPENWETPSENRSASLNTIMLKLMHFHSKCQNTAVITASTLWHINLWRGLPKPNRLQKKFQKQNVFHTEIPFCSE